VEEEVTALPAPEEEEAPMPFTGSNKWNMYIDRPVDERSVFEVILRLPFIGKDAAGHFDTAKLYPFTQPIHYPDKNMVGHFRGAWRTDEEGRKILAIDEFQGDWGQELRKYGVFKEDVTEEQKMEVGKQIEEKLARLPLPTLDNLWRALGMGLAVHPTERARIVVREAEQFKKRFLENVLKAFPEINTDSNPATFQESYDKTWEVYEESLALLREVIGDRPKQPFATT
jgi:hypothetical protein